MTSTSEIRTRGTTYKIRFRRLTGAEKCDDLLKNYDTEPAIFEHIMLDMMNPGFVGITEIDERGLPGRTTYINSDLIMYIKEL